MTPQIRAINVPRLFSQGMEEEAPPKTKKQRREELFGEDARTRLGRAAGAIAKALPRMRPSTLAPLLDTVLRDHLVKPEGLPDPARALAEPDGFCGLAVDLSPATIMEAQLCGLFPAAPLGPVAWWAPAWRWAAEPQAFCAGLQTIFSGSDRRLRFSFDRDFEEMLVRCADPEREGHRRGGLTPRLMHAFADLFDAGTAHCFALHEPNGRLIAGGIGVATGRFFVTHQSFALAPGGTHLCLYLLSRHLAAWDFALHDVCPPAAPNYLGIAPVSREAHARMLARTTIGCRLGRWTADPELVSRPTHPLPVPIPLPAAA